MTLSPEQLVAIRRSAESNVHWGRPGTGVAEAGEATLKLLDGIDRLRALTDEALRFGFKRGIRWYVAGDEESSVVLDGLLAEYRKEAP